MNLRASTIYTTLSLLRHNPIYSHAHGNIYAICLAESLSRLTMVLVGLSNDSHALLSITKEKKIESG